MAENYKASDGYARRDFLKLVGEGIVASQIPASLFASEDKIKELITKKIPVVDKNNPL